MRALQVTELIGPDGLNLVEIDEPNGDGQIVVDLRSAGVSFPDLLMSQGKYQHRPDPPFIPGVEGAGVVRSAPDGSGFVPGDRVAVFSLGCFAQTVVASPQAAFKIPDGMSFDAAAGFLMNYHTAHFALDRRGELKAGETVLVHGAAGGTGTAAVQVAKGLGARVIGVVSSESKAKVAGEAGADEVVMSDDGWLDEVRGLTEGKGVDLIFDPVGGKRFDDSVRALAVEGRLLVIGFAEGTIPQVAANRILLRNISIVGAAWGAFLAHHPEIIEQTQLALEQLIAAGHVKPIVGSSFTLENGADALRELEQRRATGKIVISIAGD